jgi:hypothetical protein
MSTEALRVSHRAYVFGTILTATSFVEAMINEICLSATEGTPYSEFGLAEDRAAAIAALWSQADRKRWPTLKKYQQALIAVGASPFDTASPPYPSIESQIALRNALTHYKPEWDDEQDIGADLEKRLLGSFPENRFSDAAEAFFPHRCLGSGCAQWTVFSAQLFVGAFRARMGLREGITTMSVRARAP